VLAGPFGSGKSVGCCIHVVQLGMEAPPDSDGVRRVRCAVVRNTMRQLRDTTIKTWLAWFPSGTLGVWMETNKTYVIKQPGLDMEVLFRALDDEADLKNLLSLDLSFAWVNECREIPQAIVEALEGRCARYPKKENGRGGWVSPVRIFADTNMPEEQSYWYCIMECLDLNTKAKLSSNGWVTFKQPGGRDPAAENLENLPAGYYTDLARNKDPESDFVRVYIDAKYGRMKAGRVVHPLFRREIHVARETLIPNPHLPIVIGADFGLTPALVFKQQDAHGRVLTLAEITTENMGLQRCLETKAKPLISRRFRDYRFVVTGDPAGAQRSQSDETTCVKIFHKAGFKRVKMATTNARVARYGATDEFLGRLTEVGPAFLVDPSCEVYAAGLETGYYYKKQKSGIFNEEPEKNSFSHVVEAGHYADMRFSSGLKDEGEKLTREIQAHLAQRRQARGMYSRRS